MKKNMLSSTAPHGGASDEPLPARNHVRPVQGAMMGWAKKVPLLGMLLIPLAPSMAAEPMGPQQVVSLLQQAGYREIRDIEFDDGLWEAEVRRPYGRWEEISIEPDTGEIHDLRGQREAMPMRKLLEALEGQGYRDFTDIDRDAGVWNIEATDAQGRRMELKVSGRDGRVLNSRFDD